MKYRTGRQGRCYNMLLDLGEDVIKEIQNLAEREGIRNGVISAGLGGFGKYGLLIPAIDEKAEKEQVWEQTLQISSLQGCIREGKAEVYSVLSPDAPEPSAFAGKNMPVASRKFYCQMMICEVLYDE